MTTRWLTALSAVVLIASVGASQRIDAQAGQGPGSGSGYEDVATRISQAGLRQLGAYTTLARLLSVGPRLTGSAQADAAVRLMAEHMTALGFDNVRTEPTTVGHWERGPVEEGRILPGSGGPVPVKVCAIGNSIATPEDGVTAGVVEVRSVAELAAVGDRARGKIVFFNGALDPTLLDTFPAYGGAAQQRSGGAAAAAKAGAIGGVDIGPLGESGTILVGLVPDSQRYFDVHHSGTDTLDKVHPRELQLGANAMALLAWLLSEEGIAESLRK
jgi:hypothetical protein